MAEAVTERTEDQIAEEYRDAAIRIHGSSVQFDAGAEVSFGNDDGAYVQGWVWVPRLETGISTEEHTDCV